MRYSETLGFRLTPIIILVLLNLVFFLVTYFIGRAVLFLGMTTDNLASQPWTIVTSMFIYVSFWHWLSNMIPLFFLGNMLLGRLGGRTFLLLYFTGGISGNALFFLLSLVVPDSYLSAILISASGTIFAIGGVLILTMGRQKVRLLLIPSEIPLYIVVLVFFLLLSLVRYSSWEAHLGGLLFGLTVGYIFRSKRQREEAWRIPSGSTGPV